MEYHLREEENNILWRNEYNSQSHSHNNLCVSNENQMNNDNNEYSHHHQYQIYSKNCGSSTDSENDSNEEEEAQFRMKMNERVGEEEVEGMGYHGEEAGFVVENELNEQINNCPFWDHKYSQLKEFQKEHGHCTPSYLSHPQLYSWLHRQKYIYRRGKLSTERENLLAEIGVQFEYHWNEMYQHLCDYKGAHNSVIVDESLDPKLSYWVWSQINCWKNGKLMGCRIDKLVLIGVTRDMEVHYTQKFPSESKKKRKKIKHTDSPKDNHKNSPNPPVTVRMDSDPSNPMESMPLNPCIDVTKPDRLLFKKSEENWKIMFDQLKTFKKHHNSTYVPIKSDKKLHLWIRTQRKSFKEGRLADWKHKRLEELGVSFPDHGATRTTGKDYVQDYVEEEEQDHGSVYQAYQHHLEHPIIYEESFGLTLTSCSGV